MAYLYRLQCEIDVYERLRVKVLESAVRDKAFHNHDDRTEPSETPEQTAGADTKEEEPEEVDVEALLHRRASPRKRAVQAGLTFLCVLAVLGLFRTVTPVPTRPSVPTPLADTNTPQVSIVANLAFGSVTVDGKKLAGPPPLFFSPAPSGDAVVFLAPPFAPQTCRVFWYGAGLSAQLGAGGSSCEMSSMNVTVSDRVSSSYTLDFQFGLEDLSPGLQATALDFVRQVVTPVSLATTVPAGQYYASGRDGQGMILSRQATAPLTAQVSLLLPTPQDLASSASWCSALICVALDVPQVPNATRGSSNELWATEIPLAMNWQFLLPDNQLVGMEHQSQVASDISLILALDSHHQWHLGQFAAPTDLQGEQRQLIPAAICGTGVNELVSAFQDQQAGGAILIARHDHGLGGCEIQITQTDGAVAGTVVWRFGVLLAADVKTHRTYPWLPLAPKAEVEAVQGA